MSRFFDELEERLRSSTTEQHARAAHDVPERRPQRRRRMRRRPLIAAALAAVGLAVPAVAAVDDVWRPDVEPAPPMKVPTGAIKPAEEITCDAPSSKRIDVGPPVDSAFTSVLGVLARPRTSADAFDRRYLRGGHLIGVDLDGIRSVGTVAGRRWFVIPAQGLGQPPLPERCLRKLDPRARKHYEQPPQMEPTVCLFGGGGSGCGSLAAIRAHGSFGRSGVVLGRADVAGLAPNGVRAVRVTYGRSTRDFPVRDNFFSFRVAVDVEQEPDRVQWLMDDGSVRDVTP